MLHYGVPSLTPCLQTRRFTTHSCCARQCCTLLWGLGVHCDWPGPSLSGDSTCTSKYQCPNCQIVPIGKLLPCMMPRQHATRSQAAVLTPCDRIPAVQACCRGSLDAICRQWECSMMPMDEMVQFGPEVAALAAAKLAPCTGMISCPNCPSRGASQPSLRHPDRDVPISCAPLHTHLDKRQCSLSVVTVVGPECASGCVLCGLASRHHF